MAKKDANTESRKLAIKTLEALLKSPDEQVRMKAARLMLSFVHEKGSW